MGREDKAMLDSNQLLLYTAAIAIGFLLILKACGWLIRLSGISGQMLQVAYIAVELLIALVVYWTFRKTIRLGEKHILTESRFLFCFLYLGIPCLAHFGMNLLGGNLKKGFAEVLIAAFRGLSVGV